MRNNNLINMKQSKYHEESYIVINPSEEAKICLNCPFPTCKKPNLCKHYAEEIKKLREKKKC